MSKSVQSLSSAADQWLLDRAARAEEGTTRILDSLVGGRGSTFHDLVFDGFNVDHVVGWVDRKGRVRLLVVDTKWWKPGWYVALTPTLLFRISGRGKVEKVKVTRANEMGRERIAHLLRDVPARKLRIDSLLAVFPSRRGGVIRWFGRKPSTTLPPAIGEHALVGRVEEMLGASSSPLPDLFRSRLSAWEHHDGRS